MEIKPTMHAYLQEWVTKEGADDNYLIIWVGTGYLQPSGAIGLFAGEAKMFSGADRRANAVSFAKKHGYTVVDDADE